jgi:hypothetical protein
MPIVMTLSSLNPQHHGCGAALKPQVESKMTNKFNPAPHDKHAADPKQSHKAAREISKGLVQGLEESFPASDPVSSAQPAKLKPDADT